MIFRQVHQIVGVRGEELVDHALAGLRNIRGFGQAADFSIDILMKPVGGAEERGHAVKVLLRPVGKRVVVALRAGHVGREEGG